MKHSEDLIIFNSKNGKVTYGDIVNSFKKVGADKCKILLLHTGISFGIPSKEINRKQLMELLYDAISELNIETLVMPTFTFSFSNYEVFDVNNSKTRMGMLNEYVRKLPGVVRSNDPMMSFCVKGKNTELINTHGNKCLGEGSFFDNLHKTEDVNIAFFGTDLEDCFTYQHYVEEQMRVPYRYDKEFKGYVIDEKGNEKEQTYVLYVKYRDVIPFTPPEFVDSMINRGIFKKVKLGDANVSCFSEKDAYNETYSWIKKNVNGFLAEPYDTKPLVKEYSYGNVTTVQ